MATILSRAGFTVLIRVGLRRYLAWNDYGRMSLGYPKTYAVGCSGARHDLLLTDDPDLAAASTKSILVRYDFSEIDGEAKSRSLYFPIMQHPNLLRREMAGEMLVPQDHPARDMAIFFAGNVDKELYDKPHFRDRYGIANRYELITTLRESPELASRLKSYVDYSSFRVDLDAGLLANSLVLFDATEGRIPQSVWLGLMARSAYFLALPGYTQPFCHNLVEAMMVGTVPVLEYGNYLYPALRNGIDALEFSGTDGLVSAVREILDGKIAGRRDMETNARRYYTERLSLDAAAQAVRDFLAGPREHTELILARGL